MLRYSQAFNAKFYFRAKFMQKGLLHMDTMFSKEQLPIHVVTRIPGVQKCLEIALPNAKIQSVVLQDEFSDVKLQPDMKSVSKAEIMICDGSVLAKILPHVPALKWAHCTWAGVEPIISAVKTSNVMPHFMLTRHSGKAFTTLMAEYVLCQMINWERCMKDLWKNQQIKSWDDKNCFINYRPLSKLVICILGVGNMGSSIAKFLKSFGTVVLGLSRSPKNLAEYPDFDLISTSLSELLPQCDYLCNVLPSTDETFHMLDGDVLSQCSKKPVFINVGRGNVIQERYLVQALRNEWISGAILDVFEQEPLPESSVLWTLPQVVITPHVACVSLAEHIVEDFLANYNQFCSGGEMKHTVNWDTGY